MFDLPVLANLVNSIPDSPALCKFPFLHARATRRFWMRRHGVWWILGLLLIGVLLGPVGTAAAQDAPPVDHAALNATLFIGPRTRTSARLEGLRVEATIEQEGARTWADVQAWFRLQNPLASALPLDAVLQGLDTTPAAHAVTLTVGGVPQPLIAQGATNHWRWQTTLPGNGRLEPLLSYRVPLGDGALARFRYDLVNGWRRAPGSLRVTLRFPDGLAADQLLLARPAGYTFDGHQLTWSFDNRTAVGSLELLILPSAAWHTIQAAQVAAMSATASAADHLALGRWYHRLALADNSEEATLFERYYPQALAALAPAYELAPDDPAAARLLADLYLRQASRAAPGTPYRALAAAALATARARGDNSPELQATLARLTIDLAQATDNWRGAVFYLDQLASLDTAAWPADTPTARQAVTRTAALAQAQEALARGDPAGARALAETVWGSSPLAVPGAAMAGFLSQRAAVSLSASQYVITMALAPRPTQRQLARATLQRAVADAQTVPGVAAALEDSVDPSQLVVTIRFSGPADLRDKRTRLANLIAAEPDLALLHALLAVRDLDLTTTTATFWQTQQLTDTLDLPAVYRAWTDQAARYQQAIDSPGDALANSSSPGLAPVARVLWQVEGAAWQDLATNSEVRYRAELTRSSGAVQAQTWVSGLAAPLTVQLSVSDWRVAVLLAAGIALLLLIVTLAWLFWRFV